MKTWKRRWFILTDNCLYYFEYTTVSGLLQRELSCGRAGAGLGVSHPTAKHLLGRTRIRSPVASSPWRT